MLKNIFRCNFFFRVLRYHCTVLCKCVSCLSGPHSSNLLGQLILYTLNLISKKSDNIHLHLQEVTPISFWQFNLFICLFMCNCITEKHILREVNFSFSVSNASWACWNQTRGHGAPWRWLMDRIATVPKLQIKLLQKSLLLLITACCGHSVMAEWDGMCPKDKTVVTWNLHYSPFTTIHSWVGITEPVTHVEHQFLHLKNV